MKNHEFVLATLTLLVAFGAASFMLGRSYWRRGETLVRWIFSIFSSTIVLMAALYTLLVYFPELSGRIASPVNGIIGLIALMGLSGVYRRLFKLGDRSGIYIPDPNRLYEVDDIPDMPATIPETK